VKSAVVVQSSFDSLSAMAGQCTPQEFADAWLAFVLEVQTHLGETGDAPIAG